MNTLAPFVLTTALLPIIARDGRILNLSSAAQAPVNVKGMAGGVPMADMEAYAQSKRAITLWSQHLAQDLPERPAVISVNPGSLLASKMVKEGFGIEGSDLRIGSDILCRLALEQGYANDSGKYWDYDAGRFAPVDAGQATEVVEAIKSLV